MASLFEELTTILERENEIYESMIPAAEAKTKIIVDNDLKALQEITGKEQLMIEKVGGLERKRQEVIINMGTVLNRNPSTLNFKTLIQILNGQPEEQKRLRELHDVLSRTVKRLADINNHNKSLIQQSLEMIEFNMNFIQSTRMSPGIGQYSNKASELEMRSQTGMFDARQ